MTHFRIRFSNRVFKALKQRLKKAFDDGDTQTARRVWTLLILGKGISIEEFATMESI